MLITGLLLQEQERTGTISLRDFYIRRTLRIFPAMWFYVAVMAALAADGYITLYRHDVLYALTYTVNYFPDRSWYVSHIWSLSLEEQFYLLWPLVLCLGGRRMALRAAIGAIALVPILRALLFVFFPGWYSAVWYTTPCDSIAMGCVLALLPSGRFHDVTAKIIASRWFVLVPILVVPLNAHVLGNRTHGLLRMSLTAVGILTMNFGIALTVQRVVAYPRDFAGTILNAAPVIWLGRISYSLYLWQMPFLNQDVSNWITRTPVNLVAAVCAACCSYYFIENPLLRLRKRLGWGEEKRASMPDLNNIAAAEALN